MGPTRREMRSIKVMLAHKVLAGSFYGRRHAVKAAMSNMSQSSKVSCQNQQDGKSKADSEK